MRKIIYICIVAIALLCVTACSQDFYAGLGSFMGGMGNNIYGIKPDVRKAQASANLVTESITYKTNADGSISATINLDMAASIINDIGDIKKSRQRSDALREYLSQEISDDKEAVAVKTALKTQMTGLKTTLSTYVDPDYLDASDEEAVSDVIRSIISAIDEINYSLDFNEQGLKASRKPCMADVAVAAVLNKMAASLMEETVNLDKASDLGKASVDTLKIIAGVSTLDVLADVDVSSLVSNIGKDISRSDSGVNPILGSLLGKTAAKIVDLITTNKQFDVNKYYTFIMESKALKAAYEMTCMKYMPEEKTILNLMSSTIDTDFVVDSGLTIEDVFMYLIFSLNIALEDYSVGFWGQVICEYVQEGNNYAILSDLEHATESPSSLTGSINQVIKDIFKYLNDEYKDEVQLVEDFDWEKLMDKIDDKRDNDEDYPDYDLEDEMNDIIQALSGDETLTYSGMMETIGDTISEAGPNLSRLGRRFSKGVNNVLTTTLVMIYDSEYESLFNFLDSLLKSMFPGF